MLRLARASSVGLRNNRGGGHSALGFWLWALGFRLSGYRNMLPSSARPPGRGRPGLRGPVLNAQLNTQVRVDSSFASLLRMTIVGAAARLSSLGSRLPPLGLSQHVAELRSTARTRASGLRGPVLNAQLNTHVRADCSFASLLRMTILNNVGMNLKCFGMTNPKCFRGQF